MGVYLLYPVDVLSQRETITNNNSIFWREIISSGYDRTLVLEAKMYF